MKTTLLVLLIGLFSYNIRPVTLAERYSDRIPASREETVALKAEICKLHADIENLRENDRKGREEMMRLSREIYYLNNPNIARPEGLARSY